QGGQVEGIVYIDSLFEYLFQNNIQNNILHVMDNEQRVALVRVGVPFGGDQTPALKIYLGDHLSSSNIALDETGATINQEEYLPYGETSFGSFAMKRYRF